MMDLPKPLQEAIKNNQFNLKSAIKNHQALVTKLRANYDDPAEIKQQLADVQKYIIELGEAQKILVVKVRKEITAKSWHNNNNSLEDETISPDQSYSSHNSIALQSSSLGNCRKEIISPLENEHRGKRKREYDEDDENDEDDEDEEVALLSPSKRNKPMLSDRRSSTPSAQDFQTNDTIASSSEESPESTAEQEPLPLDNVSKEKFMGLLNLITKEKLAELQNKNRERRRRRLAGRHSLYTSHWDLTVQRRSRARHDRDSEQQHQQQSHQPQQEFEKDDSPIGSPPIVEIKKRNDSSSASTSPSPPPVKSREDTITVYGKSTCVICRKQGILSVCDNCSATYHWSCLDKMKICPQCQVGQIGGPDSQNQSRSGSPNPNPTDDTVSKVLGDTSKPPTRVSSMEVIARYFNRNNNSNDENNFTERLKVKKMLEARKAALKVDLATLEEKASQLSASLVHQTANLKELSAGEEKIRERIKIVVDFIQSMKKSENTPS